MSSQPIAPQAHRPQTYHQASHMMHNYSHSPLARSTTDLTEGVTHEYEPDVDADGFRHPGNHHAEDPGDYSPGSTLRPQSRSNRHSTKSTKFRSVRAGMNEESKPNSFTFEHEPDVDAEGFRNPHENMTGTALRALQDVVVPLDPRAGRIVITPSPSLKPNYSPYHHNDDIPTRSIEDLQDPEELHSHANMIYGIDEARASQFSVPDWQEGEAAMFIEEASHGDLHAPTVPNRPVAKKLPIKPTGELMAPVGNISGDNEPVGPTRSMKDDERKGIDGAYTVDGEGSAGMPFDGNAGGAAAKEGDIEVQDESSVVPPDMMSSTDTIKERRMSSIASNIEQPEKPKLSTPGPVEDVKIPQEKPLSQDGSAMEVPEGAKDERPEWLRVAEMMANNDYDKLIKERLVTDERASNESIDFASAARATLLRDSKIERGSSYPTFSEMQSAGNASQIAPTDDTHEVPRQGVSALPEKDLGGANPPSGSKARDDKFSVEDETVAFKAKDGEEPDLASKFLGLSAGAATGASVPAAALMTSARDAKSHTAGENRVTEIAGPASPTEQSSAPGIPAERPASNKPNDVVNEVKANLGQPAIPRRPQRHSTTEAEASVTTAQEKSETSNEESKTKAAPAVPRRPVSSTGNKDAPAVPQRPVRTGTLPKDTEIKAPMPIKPSVPARPAVGKLGGSKFAFASALEAKLKSGPPAPKPKTPVEADITETATEPAKPLADARKGRARGPTKRKPATIAPVEEEPNIATALDTNLLSPVCEKGDIFTSRFGVEMRNMSIQTGVIRIESPNGNVTVMEGAGTEYEGQTVVVDSDTHKAHAISKEESRLETNSTATAPRVTTNIVDEVKKEEEEVSQES